SVHLLLVMPAAWVLLEWFRGWFLSGFPWLALGYTHLDTPISGLAPVGGVYTVSLAVAMCAGALAAILRGNLRVRIVALAVFTSLWLLRLVLWKQAWTEPIGRAVSVAIVQGAVRP